MYDAVSQATESFYINVYLPNSTNMYNLIYKMMLANPNLNVRIFIDGTPVDGDAIATLYASYLLALAGDGADVRMIGMGSNARYVQDHAKYVILDMETVVITLENLVTDNLNSFVIDDVYRGWGVVIKGMDYAKYMYNVFANDFSIAYRDVYKVENYFIGIEPVDMPTYREPESMSLSSYGAQVIPILSKGNSFAVTEYYINATTERLYSEQQSLNSTYQDPDYESPLAYMAQKVAEGVDYRLIIGTGVTNYSDVELVINETTFITAATVTTPYVHNKRIISDDVAIVSFVNWTPSSFHNNMEGGMTIYSKDVAKFFAETFLADFYEYYDFDGFIVDVTQIESSYPAGKEIVFTVSIFPEFGNYTYVWGFGNGSDPVTTYLNRVVHTPTLTGDAGAFELTVTVSSGMVPVAVSKEYTVGTTESSGDAVLRVLGEYLYIIIPIVMILLAVVGTVIRSGNKRKRLTKGK